MGGDATAMANALAGRTAMANALAAGGGTAMAKAVAAGGIGGFAGFGGNVIAGNTAMSSGSGAVYSLVSATRRGRHGRLGPGGDVIAGKHGDVRRLRRCIRW